MGEGGAILINEEKYLERAEILREKGTNRAHFSEVWLINTAGLMWVPLIYQVK